MENLHNNNYDPALYQLVGPIESLYQLVPMRDDEAAAWRINHPLLQQQNNSSRNIDNRALVLLPINQQQRRQFLSTPQPFLDAGQNDFAPFDSLNGASAAAAGVAEQFHLALVPVGNYELQLFNEDFHQLAGPNELDGPIQLLAIEGPPQFQLVGPVPQLARIRCRFSNASDRMVDLVWTDDNNRMYRYAKLDHEDFVDITTFEGHQWIFCDALDGEIYLINPGMVRKFVASNGNAQRAGRGRQQISAVRSSEDLTLQKITLRILAQKLFDAWENGAEMRGGSSMQMMPPMNLLLQSMRLPPFIQIQLAQFVLSCILYQMKFDGNQLSRTQRQIFQWLVQFLRTNGANHEINGNREWDIN